MEYYEVLVSYHFIYGLELRGKELSYENNGDLGSHFE